MPHLKALISGKEPLQGHGSTFAYLHTTLENVHSTSYIIGSLFYAYLYHDKGSFSNHVNMILLFFDKPPSSMDICYVLKVDKNGKF